jgi:hypothetical protein
VGWLDPISGINRSIPSLGMIVQMVVRAVISAGRESVGVRVVSTDSLSQEMRRERPFDRSRLSVFVVQVAAAEGRHSFPVFLLVVRHSHNNGLG